jgi:hypothetical protein
MTNTNLTNEQKEALDEMIQRRVTNTGETVKQAKEHILNYLLKR